MITAAVDDMQHSDAERLKRWLAQPEFDLLIASLKSNEAKLKVEALADVDAIAGDVSRGGQIPESAILKLRRASTFTVVIRTLAEMAGLFAQNHANVVALEQTQKDHPFSTYDVELDVQDLAHLTRILSALRASDAVAQAERL